MTPLFVTLTQLPLLLAQADTPADATPTPADTPTPDSSPVFTSSLTINGQPATPEQIAQFKSFFLIFGLVGFLVGLIFIATLWRVYTKAGKPGWTSIIPFYNAIVLLEIAGRPAWWFLLMCIPLVNVFIAIIVMIDLARSFGRGTGFGLGLAFLSPLFLLILGFGSSRYVGPAALMGAGGYPAGGYPPATM